MFACILLLGTREKKKICVSAIKNFNPNKHVPTQKYKLVGENPSTQCIILFMKDTEEEVDQMMGAAQRVRQPSHKLLQSAAESTDDDERPLILNNRKRREEREGGECTQNALKKRLQALRNEHNKENSKENENVVQQKHVEIVKQWNNLPIAKVITDKTEICKKCDELENNEKLMKTKFEVSSQKIEMLQEEVTFLKEELMKFKEEVTTLQNDVKQKKEQLITLQELNLSWQKLGIEKYKKLEDVHMAKLEAPSTCGGSGEPPIGFITPDGLQIHIGRGLYLSTQAWYLALNVPTTRKITFARNILVALCGYDYLSRVTVTGKGSNRNKQSQKPEFQLDPKILLAIRDVYSYFLVTEKNWKKDEADVEAGRVHSVISKKIADVKKAKKKAFDVKSQKTVMGVDAEEATVEEVMDVPEKIDSDPELDLQIDEGSLIDVASDEEITNSDSSNLIITSDNSSSLERDEDLLRIINGEQRMDIIE